ncbi:MAG: DUF4339 domain-containing protein [Taibaiella sp.]|nr:DUF4339 domain-containing protein [Taibaiella sp.]
MSKYYIHNGSKQEGPFGAEELISRGITADTPIWHGGITDWTTADNIDELKGKLNPPTFKTPPPEPLSSKSNSTKTERKSSKGFFVVFILAVVCLIGYLWMNSVSADGPLPNMKIQLNSPKPAVLTTRADKSKSDIKMRATIYGTVQNQGGDGNVIVSFNVMQDGNTYERTRIVSLRNGETKEVEATFDEVTRLGGEISYRVYARAE